MRIKEIVACASLADGLFYLDTEHTEGYKREEIPGVMQTVNNLCVDRLIVRDDAEDEHEHEAHLLILKAVCSCSEMPVTAGGYVNRMEDVKSYIYAGANSVILEASSERAVQLLKDTSGRFGRESIMLALSTIDIMFKQRELVETSVDRILVTNHSILDSAAHMTSLPLMIVPPEEDPEKAVEFLGRPTVYGAAYPVEKLEEFDVMGLKNELFEQGITVSHLEPQLEWSNMKTNEAGLVPVVVQDYVTNEVLMLAYMNEASFRKTLICGKMTYWSRSRQELWTKGETSGHYQYVKSLTADCDRDTILAQVSQVGAACHTGNRTCFFYNIFRRETNKSNALSMLLETYRRIEESKAAPQDGTMAGYLFEQGLDKILVNLAKENAQILMAAKNGDPEVTKTEIADYLYLLTMLMVENDITYEDVISELSYRE